MQCIMDEDGAEVKQRGSPEVEAAVMQRCRHEDKALDMQRSGDADDAEEGQ